MESLRRENEDIVFEEKTVKMSTTEQIFQIFQKSSKWGVQLLVQIPD